MTALGEGEEARKETKWTDRVAGTETGRAGEREIESACSE